jgi:putative transposase
MELYYQTQSLNSAAVNLRRFLSNRTENARQPVRRRERIMKRFKSRGHPQRFVSIHDPIANLFHIPRYDISSSHHRELRVAAMNMWTQIAHV